MCNIFPVIILYTFNGNSPGIVSSHIYSENLIAVSLVFMNVKFLTVRRYLYSGNLLYFFRKSKYCM
ncbi:MAG: chitobiase/beta-hexosaminidase C-terminal domain-containing protein [Flavobacteriaceae bacterium]|nr:chitobiase/beta-hexosaminidase C-terminal domain-containing protein [Flavobacteriaceae bacterium]